ncbi:hypothetical protein MVES1_002867 [Malassezia vespertilionis]|uniref:Eukaryotic translation initiation factor 3 subunit M n=1 Tax=Malassezia vespertilionis TaxID=2020962 RepID=A0A2N1JAI7_9BASI|nr:uncharacterized protein MVES1_002867 [Malassezia vespertilionis]PKI83559.1 hypothetical protein MVES_002713 [Malassezia vespertilionis]WFD07501.1 hypothetical protein MVES1_002867 [Malassezia vespertilionis]
MRSDLVYVLNEGSLLEYTEEIALIFSSAFPEPQRAEWVESLTKEAAAVDETQEADQATAKACALVSKLIKSAPGIVEGKDREIEGLYNLLFAMLQHYFAPTDAEYKELLMHLVKVVSDTSSPAAGDRSVAKYRVLANAFNLLPVQSPERATVFNALFSLASLNGDMDFLCYALDSLPTWLAQWEVLPEQKNEYLGIYAAALQDSECEPDHVNKAYQYLLLHLRYISNETALSQETRRASAEKNVADMLRLPKLFEMEEVMNVPVTTELDGTPIFALLKIFVGGTRVDLNQWAQSADGKASIERFHLDLQDLERKMRLLDLATLCARSVSSEVSYQGIAEVLGVDIAEVESWVIDVIRAGLVSGKLSQVKQSFRVYRSTHRTFEKPQWEALEERLVQWQKSIQTLITTIKTTQSQTRANSALEALDASTQQEPQNSETAAAAASS